MNKEYYDILGVSEDATDEEIAESYRNLKKKYNEERWLEGEAGNEAAKMLNKLDVAYQEIMSFRREKARNTSGKSAFEEIEALIKAGNIQEAQNKLDAFNERNAQWHYLQAAVFYKKQWMNECKKQLEIAMQLDPENAKYKTEYERINSKTSASQDNAQNAQGGNYRFDAYGNTNSDDADQMGGSGCNECLSWCTTCLCANMCINLCCGCH